MRSKPGWWVVVLGSAVFLGVGVVGAILNFEEPLTWLPIVVTMTPSLIFGLRGLNDSRRKPPDQGPR